LEADVKKIINWFKDLFYNATDYAIILCVVVIVAAVLFWRFDILFNLKVDKDTLKPNPINISDNKDKDKPDNSDNNSDNKPSDDNNQGTDTNKPPSPVDNGNSEDDKKPEQGDNSNPANDGAEISFNIPEGTVPGKIADILIDKALIEDKQTFLTRSIELKLDTKLKAGDFKIKKGTSLDDVIKIIAKQK
jgi:cell division protein YceG involved in septum cleavage